MRASEVLKTAESLITGDRAKTHGPALENHMNIAALWSAYLGVEISPFQAAINMALLKLARTKTGEDNDDDLVDAAAYIALAAQIREEMRDHDSRS